MSRLSHWKLGHKGCAIMTKIIINSVTVNFIHLCAVVSIKISILVPPRHASIYITWYSDLVNDTFCGMSLTCWSFGVCAPAPCEGVSCAVQLYLIPTNEQHHKSDGLLSSHCAGLSVIKEQDLGAGLSFVHIRLQVPWPSGATSNSVVNITQVLPFSGTWKSDQHCFAFIEPSACNRF